MEQRWLTCSRPLVAFLDRAKQHHRWVVEPVEELEPPLLVCEPVLAGDATAGTVFERAGCIVWTS